MSSLKHTHSYVRFGYGTSRGKYKDPRYNQDTDSRFRTHVKCSDPACTHYTTKALAVGKNSLCPRCKMNVFVLTPEQMRVAMPVCLECRDSKEGRAYRAAKRLSDLMLVGEDELG